MSLLSLHPRLIGLLLACLLLIAGTGAGVDGAEPVTAPDADWGWECELPDKVFGQFGSVPVRVSLTNHSKEHVTLRRFHTYGHYGITIKNSNNRILVPTAEGESGLHPQRFFGSSLVSLKPGETYRLWLDLRKFFNFGVDKYTVQISVHITAEDPDGKRPDAVIDKVSPVMRFEISQKAP